VTGVQTCALPILPWLHCRRRLSIFSALPYDLAFRARTEEGIIETKSAELLEPIYAKLADAAKSVAKAQSLDIILDLEQVNPLFVSESLDVTEAVLAEMAKLR